MKIGLKPGTVCLQEHNPNWDLLFEEEKKNLEKLLDKQYLLIEHIGSTSIPTIKAKPIIDILLVVSESTDMDTLVAKFENASYHKCSFQPNEGEILFKKGDDRISTHYIHIVLANKDWQRYTLFKEHLKTNIEIAKEYENLKIKLSKKFNDDRRQYTSSKEKHIENILSQLR